jgi:DNA-binding transcriptional regulator YiaG
MTPGDIRALRAALGESVATFGARFARGGRAVEEWEQGRRTPDALVIRALDKLADQVRRRQARRT